MTSPATMRLMGLLVIVGMVAGCGGDEPSMPGNVGERVVAALTMDDVEMLDEESSALDAAIVPLHDSIDWGGRPWADTDALGTSIRDAWTHLQMAHEPIGLMRLAITNGDHAEARRQQEEAREYLRTARDCLSIARKAKSGK